MKLFSKPMIGWALFWGLVFGAIQLTNSFGPKVASPISTQEIACIKQLQAEHSDPKQKSIPNQYLRERWACHLNHMNPELKMLLMNSGFWNLYATTMGPFAYK